MRSYTKRRANGPKEVAVEAHLDPEALHEVLAPWQEQNLQGVVHLLGCETCQRLALAVLERPPGEEDARSEPGYAALTGPVMLQAATALALCEELLAMDGGQRRQAVGQPRFSNLFLAELLLEESERIAGAAPAESEELAHLAFELGGSIGASGGGDWLEEVLARSCCLLGNARRLRGDLAGAELWLRRAVGYLADCPSPPVRAAFCLALAQLREEQDRPAEAETLLWRAAGIYRDLGYRESQGECLCRLGFLALKQCAFARASSILIRSWLLLPAGRSPVIGTRAGLGLAVCLAALGQREPAQRLLAELIRGVLSHLETFLAKWEKNLQRGLTS